MKKVRQCLFIFTLIFSVSLLAQTTQSEKIDLMQFLENIKQLIKAKMLELKARKSKRKDKSEILKQKIKIRKKLIEKLSNPALKFRKPEHYIRNVKGQKPDVKSAGQNSKISENNLTFNKSPNLQISQSINRMLKGNPLLMPFSLPDLKQFLKTAKSQMPEAGSEDNNKAAVGPADLPPEYLSGLRQWYIELSKNAINFWLFFKRFFVDNKEGLEYLKNDICKGEFNESGSQSKEVLQKDIYQEYILNRANIAKQLSLEDVINNIFYPLFMRGAGGEGGQYTITNRVVLSCGKSKLSPKNISKETICTGLARLDLFGRCSLASVLHSFRMMPLEYVYYCLVKNQCEKIRNNVKQLDTFAKQWFKFASELFKKQLLPAVFDLCYNKCRCKSLGIDCLNKNPEQNSKNKGNIYIELYYNIMKGKIEEDVLKLISSKYMLEQLISDSPQCEITSLIKSTLNDLSQYDVNGLNTEFKMLDAKISGCPADTTVTAECTFDAGVCKSQQLLQLHQNCKFNLDRTTCEFSRCKWTGSECIAEPPNCSQFKEEDCLTFPNNLTCIWYNKQCIPIDTYCSTLPPPGKGSFDTVLFQNLLARIGNANQILDRFSEGLVEILNKSGNNLSCNMAILRRIISQY